MRLRVVFVINGTRHLAGTRSNEVVEEAIGWLTDGKLRDYYVRYEGRLLDPRRTMEECHIGNLDEVHVHCRLRGGNK